MRIYRFDFYFSPFSNRLNPVASDPSIWVGDLDHPGRVTSYGAPPGDPERDEERFIAIAFAKWRIVQRRTILIRVTIFVHVTKPRT